nr:MAG TPA: hypothetical protein [Caudoviricetes sp.]
MVYGISLSPYQIIYNIFYRFFVHNVKQKCILTYKNVRFVIGLPLKDFVRHWRDSCGKL